MATLEKHVKRGYIKTLGKSDDKNTLSKARDGKTEPMKKNMDASAKGRHEKGKMGDCY